MIADGSAALKFKTKRGATQDSSYISYFFKNKDCPLIGRRSKYLLPAKNAGGAKCKNAFYGEQRPWLVSFTALILAGGEELHSTNLVGDDAGEDWGEMENMDTNLSMKLPSCGSATRVDKRYIHTAKKDHTPT